MSSFLWSVILYFVVSCQMIFVFNHLTSNHIHVSCGHVYISCVHVHCPCQLCALLEERLTVPALTWTSRDWILPSSFSAIQRYVWGWWSSFYDDNEIDNDDDDADDKEKTHLCVDLLLVVAGAEGRKDQVSVVHHLCKISFTTYAKYFLLHTYM